MLYELLCCPRDGGAPLSVESTGDTSDLVCPRCQTRFPVRDGLVSFLSAQELGEQLDRERQSRDRESSWYDTMFEGYTNAVEVPTAVRRIGRPTGPILDAGCGTGRITEALLSLGQPIVAVDYSEASLRMMQSRTAGADVPVLAVQSDLRSLPLRSGVIHATTCIEVYGQLRAEDRRRLLEELERVMVPGAPLSMSAYNYNLLFRAWGLRNERAREGEHMLGGDFYYVRLREDEYRRELEAVFDVEELTGIRNIPARSLAGALRRVGVPQAGDRLLAFMVDRGHRADFWVERTPLAGLVGFFWLARAVRRAG
jgi:SAM-dependent methyltransferase